MKQISKLGVSLSLFMALSCAEQQEIAWNEIVSDSDIPTVVAGKVNKAGNMEFYAHGPSRWDRNDTISEQHIFRIASMTKAIASVAALQLVEQGLISLDEPLDDYLPEMAAIPILNAENELVQAETSITLRHLLTHTAGFGYWFTSEQLANWGSLKEELNYENAYQPRLFEAGTSYMYGTNTDWVGRLVEKISNTSLEEYFRTHITGPLEMNSTWFNVPEDLQSLIVGSSNRDASSGELIQNEYTKPNVTSSYNAGGGLFSSPKDYAVFLNCMLNKGAYQGGRILKEETFDLLNSRQLNDFNQIHRYVPVGNVDLMPRGDKDVFFDSYDNWTLALAHKQNSKIRPEGTADWAGFFNTYFTIDFENEFALVYMTQILPFNDMQAYNLFTSFENEVYKQLNP